MIKNALLGLVGLSIILAAASVAIFAAAFSLFVVLADAVGVAGAAAIVALVAVLVVLSAILLVSLKFRAPKHSPEGDGSITGKLFAIAREKPLLSASVAAAAAVIAFRNPKLITALLTGVLAGKASPKR